MREYNKTIASACMGVQTKSMCTHIRLYIIDVQYTLRFTCTHTCMNAQILICDCSATSCIKADWDPAHFQIWVSIEVRGISWLVLQFRVLIRKTFLCTVSGVILIPRTLILQEPRPIHSLQLCMSVLRSLRFCCHNHNARKPQCWYITCGSVAKVLASLAPTALLKRSANHAPWANILRILGKRNALNACWALSMTRMSIPPLNVRPGKNVKHFIAFHVRCYRTRVN